MKKEYTKFSESPKLMDLIDSMGGIDCISLDDYIKVRDSLGLDSSEGTVEMDFESHREKASLIKRRFCFWCKKKILEFCLSSNESILVVADTFKLDASDFANVMLGQYMEYNFEWYIDLSRRIIDKSSPPIDIVH